MKLTKNKQFRGSFSSVFGTYNCPRKFYYQKVAKLPGISNLDYANAGNCVHNLLEDYIKRWVPTTYNEFLLAWKQSSINDLNVDDYFEMYKNGMIYCDKLRNENLTLVPEMCFSFDDIIGFFDVVDVNNHIVIDWKTSKIRPASKKGYIKQLKLYSWLYFRKFGVIPEVRLVFLRDTSDIMSITFEKSEIDFIEKEYMQLYEEIKEKITNDYSIDKWATNKKECFFCGYKHLCLYNNNKVTYKFILKENNIYLKANEGVIDGTIDKLIGDNLQYEVAGATFIRKSGSNWDGIVRFYSKKLHKFPIGFFTRVKNLLIEHYKKINIGFELEIIDLNKYKICDVDIKATKLKGITLYDYQREAVEKAVSKERGIIQLPTGAGKTVIFSDIVRKLKVKTLIVVDTILLLNQIKTRLEHYLDIEVGIIGNGLDIQKDITVATMQTLTKNIYNYKLFLDNVNCLIIDECQIASTTSIQTINKFTPNKKYIIGTSATPTREDGEEMKIEAILGDVIYKKDREHLEKLGIIHKPIVNFMTYENKDIEGIKYHDVYVDGIVNNDERNNVIKNLTKHYDGKQILILTKLLEHQGNLKKLIPDAYIINGGLNEIVRKNVMKGFEDGKIKILIATISIFEKGVDIPRLDVVINASANKGKNREIQSLGRVLRLFEGKEKAVYIDFIDKGNRFLFAHSNKRVKALREDGVEVNKINIEKLKEK